MSFICDLSGKKIEENTEIVLLSMVKKDNNKSINLDVWSTYSPNTIILEGVYKNKFKIENINIFDSLNQFTESEKEESKKILSNYLQDYIKVNDEKLSNLDDLFNPHVIYGIPPFEISVMKQYVLADKENKLPDEMKSLALNLISSHLKFKNFEEYVNYYETNKYNIKSEKNLSFMLFDKKVFMKLLDSYGSDYNDFINNEDRQDEHTIQLERHGLKSSVEAVKFMNGEEYAGSNKPLFNWSNIMIENMALDKDNRNVLKKLHRVHSLDLSLLYNYLLCIGSSFKPSLYLPENLENESMENAKKIQSLLKEENSVMKMKL